MDVKNESGSPAPAAPFGPARKPPASESAEPEEQAAPSASPRSDSATEPVAPGSDDRERQSPEERKDDRGTDSTPAGKDDRATEPAAPGKDSGTYDGEADAAALRKRDAVRDLRGESAANSGAPADIDRLSRRMDRAVHGFVDNPQRAVREADEVLDAAAALFEQRRKEMRQGLADGGGADTEQLRVALTRYRDLTRQLISLTAGS